MSHSLTSYQTAVNPARIELLEAYGGPVDFVKADGSWVEDENGRRYLDFLCSYGTATLGHRHSAVMAALQEALTAQSPFTNPHNISRTAGVLAEKLCQLAGTNLSKVYFGNSGSEGVEAALKFAMAHTGRSKFLSFDKAFHGFTLGALSLTGSEGLKRPFPGLALQSHQIPFGDLGQVEQYLRQGDIAGVVLEPVQGMAGARAWESEKLLALAALCRQYGTAIILDEVLTGIGRTGKWFAFQHTSGFEPDIVVVSKGLTGGAVPVCAALMTEDVYESVYRGIGRSEIHTSTLEAHLLGAAAGLAVIEVIEKNNLLERVAVLSQKFVDNLNQLKDTGAPITAVRASGLLVSFGVDDSFDRDKELWGAPGLRRRLLSDGVVTNVAAQAITNINLLPPFTLADAEMDLFFKRLRVILV
ncbi:MAG: aspartate aminotransferase family protein [Candidatus Promineifilaceae bacterium]